MLFGSIITVQFWKVNFIFQFYFFKCLQHFYYAQYPTLLGYSIIYQKGK